MTTCLHVVKNHKIWVFYSTFWCSTDSCRNPVIPVDSSGMGPEFGEIEENPQEWNQNPLEWNRNLLEWLDSAGMSGKKLIIYL